MGDARRTTRRASDEAATIESQAAGELSEARPAMEAAKAAVDCLNKNSLTELKGFKAPPSGVEKVTGAVCMMLEGETSITKARQWERAKKMMAKVDAFLQSLKDYKAETMTEDLIGLLRETATAEDFTCARDARARTHFSCGPPPLVT